MDRYSVGKIAGRRLLVRSALVFAVIVAIAVGLTVSPFAPTTPHAEAATINSFSCGDTITDNVFLTANVVCPAVFNEVPSKGV